MAIDFIPDPKVSPQIDFQPLESEAPSFISQIPQIAAQIPQKLWNVAGGGIQGAENLVAGLANIPRDVGRLGEYLNIPGVRQLAKIPEATPFEVPFVEQGSLFTRGGELAGEAAGILGTGGASLLERAGGAIAKRARALPGVSAITTRGADEAATNFVNDLLQNRKIGQAHEPIISEIRSDYSAARRQSTKSYNNALKEIENSYKELGPRGSKVAIGLGKVGELSLPKSLDEISEINITSTPIKNALKNLRQNRDFRSAHRLQSLLGKAGNKMLTSAEELTRAQGENVLSAQKTLQKEMLNNLERDGITDGAELYRQATQNYRENVAPYTSNNKIRNIISRKGLKETNPRNIHNVLKEDSGAINAIKDNLSAESRDLVLGKALNMTKGPDNLIDANQLINKYLQLDNRGFDEFINPRHQNEIARILGLQRRSSQIQKGLKVLGGLGLLGGGEEVIRRAIL